MPRRRRLKPRSWSQNPAWVTHSLGCYEAEWDAYKLAADLHGDVTVNGWIRLWLAEAVAFEKANAKDREVLDG